MSDFLLSPLTWLAIAAVLLVLFGKRLHRRAKWLCRIVVVLAVLTCTPLCANALLWLAERHPGIADCSGTQDGWPIVLLTAGYDRPPRSVDDDAALNEENFERMDAARSLARKDPASIIYVSGGGRYDIPESMILGGLLEQAGIAHGRVRLETRSRTTWENAFELRGDIRQARLVTSPAHLQRAAMAFRAAGIATCAIPSESGVTAMSGVGYVLPRRTAMVKTEQALHEFAGRVAYAWRAWRLHAASNRS
ncbi:YdcF family protein [Solilutibacter silvestris]|uniref:YdcF family protein n=1 Tax=Solilutibacter silvestris TaxID=1645665 RepID=UPI003D343928